MSTFNGYVKEFPTIRIDYFRTLADKPKPTACFLSHVHSDHLMGLESLKMPFVYCSATTRRLLLRMEKYPHRINFAKGILESRKQTYRHLQLVLRALPLHTATELELGPKCRIRVILIDANHCPGSVMFLIEDQTKAVLYTGDVRAESWWVNSVVQNPFILPFSCGQKRLDCIYLDTTFSTRDDEYRHFPTKAEGLKELLAKVAKFPEDTLFYFRAWTLGYEQVWMALSNFLRSRVHVDNYQLNLFAGAVENGRDGYSMFEGPSLIGYPVGNSVHPGCLTQSTETRLHSCEPGSLCHTDLKDRNVVWITPIVSRLEDGTEILELGAGGGMGDLYQTSELEVSDIAAIDALRSLCQETLQDQAFAQKFDQAVANAQKSGTFRLSLNSLGLNIKEELSFQEFAQFISRTDGLFQPGFGTNQLAAKDPSVASRADRVIDFPFSRHSSYDELRDLVSRFRPRDICPCTVDLDDWTEDMAMETLFGDLCSSTTFVHDTEVRRKMEEKRKSSELPNHLKRKRLDDSQHSEVEGSGRSEEVFVSAQASVGSSERVKASIKVGAKSNGAEDSSISQRPLAAPGSVEVVMSSQNDITAVHTRTQDIRAAFQSLNEGKDIITKNEGSLPPPEQVVMSCSQQSLTSSTFDSQPAGQENFVMLPQLDGADDTTYHSQDSQQTADRARRIAVRKDAHAAAIKAVWASENWQWDNLNIRCIGRKDHSKQEFEL